MRECQWSSDKQRKGSNTPANTGDFATNMEYTPAYNRDHTGTTPSRGVQGRNKAEGGVRIEESGNPSPIQSAWIRKNCCRDPAAGALVILKKPLEPKSLVITRVQLLKG